MILVNRSVVHRLFGRVNPVGTIVEIGGRAAQIIGVVQDMRHGHLHEEPAPMLFMDWRQLLAMSSLPERSREGLALGFLSFSVRSDGDLTRLAADALRVARHIDPSTTIDAAVPMAQLVSGSFVRPRFYGVLLGTLAAIAALVACFGVYGVTTYSAAQRTHEFGVRIALGARTGQVLRDVLWDGLVQTAIGIAAGVVAAHLMTRYLETMLYGVTASDRTTFALVSVLFGCVALLATYVPARRATKVSPLVALRAD